MKKKLLSIAAACVLGVQAIAMPMIANAEQGTHYVEKSDFNDVSIGAGRTPCNGSYTGYDFGFLLPDNSKGTL